MPLDDYDNLGSLVEPDQVHKACYADEQVFEKELENIFYKSWIYIGHESQVPNAGDYWTTWVGKERMILCRERTAMSTSSITVVPTGVHSSVTT